MLPNNQDRVVEGVGEIQGDGPAYLLKAAPRPGPEAHRLGREGGWSQRDARSRTPELVSILPGLQVR